MASDRTSYAVFLHPQALEALGPVVKPYLNESPVGAHFVCAEVDAGGSLFEMTLVGQDGEGRTLEIDLMIPIGMVKLVMSIRRDDEFGFGIRSADPAAAATSAAPVASAADPTPAASGAGAAHPPAPEPPPTPPPSTAAPGAAAT